jgi:chromosome segregation ATPase
MEKSNVEEIDGLKKEVSRLKSTIGGYKKANENYRKQISDLKKLANHNRAVDVEGDHLYEEKLAELERANETIKTKQSIIESFQKKCNGLIIENKALVDKVAALNDVLAEAEKTIFELRTPWWKRIF